MQEHDIGSDPNWRVQHGKGIYIETTYFIWYYGIMIYSIYIIINVWDLNQINGLYDYVSSRVFRLYNSC